MKKVIVKCRLENREAFEDKLSATDLDLGAIYWQHDRVYVPRGYQKGLNLPRLVMRTTMRAVDESPVYSLILRRHIEDSGIDIVEGTVIQNYENAVNIILQLGFKPAGEVSRRRQDVLAGENTTIFLDQLDGTAENPAANTYVKLEANLSNQASVAEVKSELLKTLEALGESNIVESAYIDLKN